MKTIRVVFSKSKKRFAPIGWTIRKFMGTGYSHVSFHFDSPSLNRTLVYEAVGSGIRFIEKKNWDKHAEMIVSYDIEICQEVYTKMLQTCIDYAGKEYGYMQNVGVLIAHLFKLDYNPFPANDNCSEILLRLIEEAGYFTSKSHDLVTPLDIENMIRQPYRYILPEVAKEL
jgi:hypothetical protein